MELNRKILAIIAVIAIIVLASAFVTFGVILGTKVTLQATSPTSISPGGSVSFTVSVVGTKGSPRTQDGVTLYENPSSPVAIATATTDNNGNAAFDPSFPSAGTFVVYAQDAYAGQVSNQITITVSSGTTTTTSSGTTTQTTTTSVITSTSQQVFTTTNSMGQTLTSTSSTVVTSQQGCTPNSLWPAGLPCGWSNQNTSITATSISSPITMSPGLTISSVSDISYIYSVAYNQTILQLNYGSQAIHSLSINVNQAPLVVYLDNTVAPSSYSNGQITISGSSRFVTIIFPISNSPPSNSLIPQYFSNLTSDQLILISAVGVLAVTAVVTIIVIRRK